MAMSERARVTGGTPDVRAILVPYQRTSRGHCRPLSTGQPSTLYLYVSLELSVSVDHGDGL